MQFYWIAECSIRREQSEVGCSPNGNLFAEKEEDFLDDCSALAGNLTRQERGRPFENREDPERAQPEPASSPGTLLQTVLKQGHFAHRR